MADQPERAPAHGLKIIIVGGGIGGLAAAVALRRNGHRISVYEQSRLNNEMGAAIHMTPNAMGVLKQIGVDPRDTGAVNLTESKILNSDSDLLESIDHAATSHRWQNPSVLAHRAHLHTLLKTTATSALGEKEKDEAGLGSVTIQTSSKVVAVDAQTGTIEFEDGRHESADVIIGADGVHSKTRHGLGPSIPGAQRIKHSAFRFMIERETLLANPLTRPLVTKDGVMNMWYGPDRKVVMYPTYYNQLLNFVCVHPASLSDASDDEYSKMAPKANLLDVYAKFSPVVLAMFEMVDPERLKIFPFFDMAKLPTYVSGRLALIGDAAHPFTPHLGQGGAQAIEDGVSLGVMLDSNVEPAQVPERLQLYNRARFDRSSTIQEYSRIVGGDGVAEGVKQATKKLKLHDYLEYGFSHDEIHASMQILRTSKWAKSTPMQWQWRQPTAFGPLPTYYGSYTDPYPTGADRATITTTLVLDFQTSATLARNLFPNDRYVFAKKDTVVSASLRLESSSHHRLGLYIHGVDYLDADHDRVLTTGTFCPVMFENVPDALLVGREDLGLPKMWSDIHVSGSCKSMRVSVSWRGLEWATLEVKNLRLHNPDGVNGFHPNAQTHDGAGIIVHKFIPSVAGLDKPDADYAVLIIPEEVPEPELKNDGSPTKTNHLAAPADARFEIRNLGPEHLPTLDPVVSRLAELPVYKVLGAKLVKRRTGSATLKGTRLG